jgi:hypothetical protein
MSSATCAVDLFCARFAPRGDEFGGSFDSLRTVGSQLYWMNGSRSEKAEGRGGGKFMNKRRALLVLGSARRVVAKLSVVVLIAFSMTTLVALAEPQQTTADQFLREAMTAKADRSELPSMFSRVSAAAQQCCKICSTGKACGDTCIARDKACHVGAGCACDG